MDEQMDEWKFELLCPTLLNGVTEYTMPITHRIGSYR